VRTGVGSGELLLLVSWCARERGEEQGRRWQAAAAWRGRLGAPGLGARGRCTWAIGGRVMRDGTAVRTKRKGFGRRGIKMERRLEPDGGKKI